VRLREALVTAFASNTKARLDQDQNVFVNRLTIKVATVNSLSYFTTVK